MAGILSGQNPQVDQGFGPEKQQQFEQAYQVGRNLLYEKPVFDSIVGQVQGNDPVQTLAEAAVFTIDKIEEDMGNLPLDVTLALGIALMGDLAEALQEAGLAQYTGEQIVEALQQATQMYLTASDRDPAEVQAAAQQMQEVA